MNHLTEWTNCAQGEGEGSQDEVRLNKKKNYRITRILNVTKIIRYETENIVRI